MVIIIIFYQESSDCFRKISEDPDQKPSLQKIQKTPLGKIFLFLVFVSTTSLYMVFYKMTKIRDYYEDRFQINSLEPFSDWTNHPFFWLEEWFYCLIGWDWLIRSNFEIGKVFGGGGKIVNGTNCFVCRRWRRRKWLVHVIILIQNSLSVLFRIIIV